MSQWSPGASAPGAVSNFGLQFPRVVLHAIEQAARPDELGREQTQTERDRQPAGTRQHEQGDADGEQREAADDTNEAFRADHLIAKATMAPPAGRFDLPPPAEITTYSTPFTM